MNKTKEEKLASVQAKREKIKKEIEKSLSNYNPLLSKSETITRIEALEARIKELEDKLKK